MLQAQSGAEESFSDVEIEAGKSVDVKVEAEVEAYGTTGALDSYRLFLMWTDMNGNEDTGKGDDALVEMSIKVSGSTKIDTTAKDTVLLKANNQTLAKFTVKPSNSNDDGITLDTLSFTATSGAAGTLSSGDIRVKIWGSEYDVDPDAGANLKYSPNEKIPTNWIEVEIILKKEHAWLYKISNININNATSPSAKTFSKKFVDAIVNVTAQENKGDYTKFTVEVDEADDDITVKNLKFYVNSGSNVCTWTSASDATPDVAKCTSVAELSNVEDGETLEANNLEKTTQSITAISYEVVNGDNVVIYKKDYEDFFKVGSETLRVFSNK